MANLEQAENLVCSHECMDYVVGLTQHTDYQVRQAATWWFTKRPAQAGALMLGAISTLSTTTDSIAARNAADILGTLERQDGIVVLTATVGRIQPDKILDMRFVVLTHNTIRGAAGAAILNAELLKHQGYL